MHGQASAQPPSATPPTGVDAQEFQELSDRWSRVASDATEERVERTFSIAGRPVRFRILGRALAQRILEGLGAHPPVEDALTRWALTVDVWDEERTDANGRGSLVAPSPPPRVPGTPDSTPDGRLVRLRQTTGLLWYDRPNARIVGCFEAAARMVQSELSKPFMGLLAVWLQDVGLTVVHAACVARGENALLIVGAAGTGKSTTSVSAALGGFDYVGDDMVALEAARDGFQIHHLFSTLMVDRDHLGRFPSLAPHARASTDPLQPKSLVIAGHVKGIRVRRTVRPTVIVLPRIVDSPATRLVAAKPTDAVVRLLPSSALSYSPTQMPHFELFSRLASTVPAHWLELGHDVRDIPVALAPLAPEAP